MPTVRWLRVNLLVAGLSSALLILGVEVFHRFKAPYRAFGGAEVRASLADLARVVAIDGAQLTVLVLPILQPVSDWKPEYREYRHLILGILESLRIRYFDLLEPLHEALADGVVVAETGDNLFWHPSREAAAYFAKYLRTQHLLDEVDAP